jgi:hypothetical protein
MGGGGTALGVSRLRSRRWVEFRRASSDWRAGEAREVEIALVEGSRFRGRRVNVSSMVVVEDS